MEFPSLLGAVATSNEVKRSPTEASSSIVHEPGLVPLSLKTASSVNEQMCQIGLIKKSTELAVGSRLTFAAHFSHTPEIATGKDM